MHARHVYDVLSVKFHKDVADFSYQIFERAGIIKEQPVIAY